VSKRYVEIPRECLTSFLEDKGFTRISHRGEAVYVRSNHNHPDLKIKVYTSLPAEGGDARGCGKDAIRVCLVYEPVNGRSFGLDSEPRVYRTGSVEAVQKRLLERMREAYDLANQHGKRHCPICDAPTWPDTRKCILRGCSGVARQ
jgi:hypothetical protein